MEASRIGEHLPDDGEDPFVDVLCRDGDAEEGGHLRALVLLDEDVCFPERFEESGRIRPCVHEEEIRGRGVYADAIDGRELSKETVSFCNDAVSYLEDFIPVLLRQWRRRLG